MRVPWPTREDQIICNLFLPITRTLQTAVAAARILQTRFGGG